MPVYRVTRTETVYIEAENEHTADVVYGLLWDGQEVGDGAQGGRLGGEYRIEAVTDHPADFNEVRSEDWEGGIGYEDNPGAVD
jgi:hypothetical protein